MPQGNPNNVNKTKSDIISWDILTFSNLTSFLIGHKIIKCFKEFYNRNHSIVCRSEQKHVK